MELTDEQVMRMTPDQYLAHMGLSRNDILEGTDMTVNEALMHYGVMGMHWGIRRDPKTGIRPIAKSLDQSRFGKMAKANANRHMRKQNTRAAAKGISGPKKSTSNNPTRKQINRNAAIDAARAAGVNPPKPSRLTPTDTSTIDSLQRVADGKASVRDQIRASGSISIVSIIRNRGYRNAAAARADQSRARNDRIRLGQTTVQDRLHQIGNTPFLNLGGHG